MSLCLIYLFSSALFLLLMAALGFQPKLLSRMTGVLLLIVGVGGVLLYGYGYYTLIGDLPQAVMRTLFSVFCMFLGRNEIGVFSTVPGLQGPLMQLLIYALHLLALFCTASAVIASMGTRLLRMVHLLLLRRGRLHLIYGADPETLSFARELMEQKESVVVFVDKSGALDGEILKMGSLLFTDPEALRAGEGFLRRIGMGRSRSLMLYCLRGDGGENLRYSGQMAQSLHKMGLPPRQSSLTILLEGEGQGAALQAVGEGPGFGTVLAVSRWELSARLMIRSVPPWETMRFDANGCAAEDFEVLVVGFGRTGQAALRSLVMNGQFKGSRLKATVLCRDGDEFAGDFDLRSPGLRKHYDIRFFNGNAHSVQAYRYLCEHAANLNYVAICTGSDKENEEIAQEYARLLEHLDSLAPLLLCTASSVRRFTPEKVERFSLYSPEILCPGPLDRQAMLLNHQYHIAEGRSPEEDWAQCDYFSRMSCRASADFLPAFLAAAGLSPREAAGKDFAFPPQLLENLAEMEHMRWCAFHRVMGYRAMPEAEFRQRAEEYRRRKAETGSASIRPGKDSRRRLHACLIPWEELDRLSALERELCGREVDYKELDRDNVRSIPDMLRWEAAYD